MEPQLSLRRLEIFRLVVEERSVTRAAELMMIAQPAVSSQLRTLEEWLGSKLFVRQGNRLVLTEAGRRADAWARTVLAGAAEVRRDVEGIESGTQGRVVCAASMGAGSYLLPEVLTRFRASHPGADITLEMAQPQEAFRRVETGEADFAVTTWDTDHASDTITSLVLREEPMVVVVRADLRPPTGSLSIEEVLRLPLVGAPHEVASQRNLLVQLRRLSSTQPEFVIRLGHALPAKQAVIDHGWAAILPNYVVAADVAAGVLAIIAVPGLDVRERIVLVRRRDKHFSTMQHTLVQQVVRDLRDADHATSDEDSAQV